MKLILVNSLSHGGGERIACNIANELIKSEDVIIVTLENEQTYYTNKKIKIIKLCSNSLVSFLFIPFKLKKIIKDKQVDVVQSHLYRSNFINVISKLIGSKHYAQIINHGDPLLYKKKGVKGFIMLTLIKALYPKADEIIAIADAMNENIKKIIPNGKNKILTINNPSNIDEIILNSCKKSDTEINIDFKYVVSMGRLIKSKNVDLLISSIKNLNIGLVIIGTGPEETKLKMLAKELKVNVIFLGQLENPFPIIKNAIAFVSASSSEGFPNSIIESLACSTPVIHSDCVSGPREILQPNSDSKNLIRENAFEITPFGALYNIGDSIALSSAIKYIEQLSDDDKKQLYLNCKQRAYEFDSSIIVKKYFR
ncbi:glycosyltransferase [Providencia huaxiensis]|uniref:glycosyltransferase n=1 Tax=Providencia huaxiensis TaxID=2027290 RepID=UPI0032DB6F84